MKAGVTIFLALAVVAAAGFGFVFSGLYDVSAVDPHTPPVRWAIETVKRTSIERRAAGIIPPALDDPGLVREGARHYAVMCTSCHDSPSRIRPLAALRMRPSPPPILVAAMKWTPSELFWIIRNGIKMTGMPSWGAAVSEAQIWAMVAFIEKAPEMAADDYRALLQEEPVRPSQQGAPTGMRPEDAPATTVELCAAGKPEAATITIAAGKTVEWVNLSDVPQAVRLHPQAASSPRQVLLPEGAAMVDSGPLPPGGRFRHRFAGIGRYAYYCPSGMPGQITVVDPSVVKPLD